LFPLGWLLRDGNDESSDGFYLILDDTPAGVLRLEPLEKRVTWLLERSFGEFFSSSNALATYM
jgi:hypothetical protein